MPIANLAEVVPTINEFLTHWALVNTNIGATPLSLPGPYTVANLTTDRDAITTLQTAVVTADNARQVAASDRDIKRSALRERLRQFRGTVIGQLGGSTYPKALPKLPSTNSKEQDFLRACDDMRDLWLRINTTPPAGYTGPLKLTGGYLLAAVTTDIAALRTAYSTLTAADETASFARKQRDAAIAPVKAKLVLYRPAVLGAFATGSPLLASIPALTPAAGSTPDPVSLSSTWNVGTTMADLSWSASDNPDLDHYAIRYHPGPTYKAAEEQAVAVVAAGTETYSTVFGLPASGSAAWFKVYVVLSTGNERGSNATKVIRP